jgi:hypothetical protein
MRAVRVAVAVVTLAAIARAADWEPLGTRDGIEVFARDSATGGVRDMQARAVIDASPERVFAVVTDLANFSKLMPYIHDSRVIKREGNTIWQYAIATPPVVSRRDYCIKVTISKDADGTFHSAWQTDDSAAPPPVDGTIRIIQTTGSWTLAPLEGGTRTQATYFQHSDPGGWIPKWMVNSGSKATGFDVMKAIREDVLLPEYQHPPSPLAPELP